MALAARSLATIAAALPRLASQARALEPTPYCNSNAIQLGNLDLSLWGAVESRKELAATECAHLADTEPKEQPVHIVTHLQRCLVFLQLSQFLHRTTQGGAYAATAAALEDFPALRAQHWAAGRGQFLDWGNHTEGAELRWAMVRAGPSDQGTPRFMRMVTTPPREQLVPHFGCVLIGCCRASVPKKVQKVGLIIMLISTLRTLCHTLKSLQSWLENISTC